MGNHIEEIRGVALRSVLAGLYLLRPVIDRRVVQRL
jgi:hypothetical protein